MDLEGLLKYHNKTCYDLSCNCSEIIDKTKNHEASEKEWYSWAHHLLKQGINKFPKSARLHYLSAVLCREKLDNKFDSLFAIYSLLASKPNIEQEFAAFRYIKFIEKQIYDHNQENFVENGLEFEKAIVFYKEFTKLEDWIKEATCKYIHFWTELLEQSPAANKISSLGSEILIFWKKIACQYDIVKKLRSNSINLLQLYQCFLKEVLNDQNESEEVKEKLRNISTSMISRQQLQDTQEFNHDEGLQKLILIISADPGTLGILTDATPEAAAMFGYKKSELVNQNITLITPPQFGSAHSTFFAVYSGSHRVNQKELEFLVYPLTKKGYLRPCLILPYVIPHFNQGLQFVFFIKELENAGFVSKKKNIINRFGIHHFVCFDYTNHSVQGITESCWDSFGLSSELVGGKNGEFVVGDFLPEFDNIVLDNSVIEDFITILDTSTLDQKFLLPDKSNDLSIHSINDQRYANY